MSGEVRVGVLGACAASLAGLPVDLGTPQQRATLAALALYRGRSISADRLIDLVWGDEMPAAAQATLQSYIARLRRALEPERPPRATATVLVSVTPGYALRLPEDAIDTTHFEHIVTDCHRVLGPTNELGLVPASVPSDVLVDVVAKLDEALALWRGTPYVELGDGADAVAERVRLEDLRIVALEDRASARIGLGQHGIASAELESLTRSYPLRERLWGLRAVALARTGRQAEALAALDEVRRLLDDELGLEPGALLRDLQTAILRQDAALSSSPPSVTAAATGGGESSTTDVRTPASAATSAVPLMGATPTPLPAWPMVGRVAQLAAVTTLLSRAESGTPAFASLVGQPGIGKSRLALELAHIASDRGVRVAVGRCSQDDGAPPLWPWTSVLSALGRELPTDAGTEDEGTRFRSWEAIAEVILEEARRAPLLVVLDDLHWADASTLRVLRLLVESANEAPLMVLLTWRLDPEPTGALADVAESLARLHAARIQLDGLSAEHAADVIEAVAADALPHHQLSVEQRNALRERTDGNPFFLVEYARLARDRGDLDALLSEADPPAAVHDVLVRRVQRLPASTQRLLSTASVIGREFDLATLARARDADEDEVLDGLDAALDAGLLRVTGPDTFLFAHALVRDTVYGGLGSRRARTHAHVAQAIEALARRRETELVRHWIAAGPAYSAQARSAAEAAAAAARQLHAYEEAAELLSTALEIVEADPAAAPRDRYDALLALGDMQRWSGNREGLIATAEKAIEAADELGDVELLANAAIQATIGALWQSAGYGEVHRGVVDALRRALNGLDASDSALRCRTLLALANETYHESTNQERDLLAERAIAMAERLDDPSLLLDAYLTSFMSTWRAATARQRLDYAGRARDLAERTGEQRSRAISETLLAVVSAELGSLPEMWRWADLARVSCERLKLPYGLLVLDNLLLPWHAMAGRNGACEEIMERMYALDSQMSLSQYEDAAAGAAMCMALWQGRTADVVDPLLAMEDSPIPITTVVAMFLARAGLIEEARAHLASHPVSFEREDWFSQLEWGAGAEAAFLTGDETLGARAYEKLAPYAGVPCCAGSGMHVGPVDAYLAMAAAAVGDPARASAHAEAAFALCEQWDIPLVATWLRESGVAQAS